MAAVIISIADAVVSALNAASLSQSFTAGRSYVPVHTLRDLIDLTVSVVPATLEGLLLDRAGRNQFSYDIHVGIQKAIGSGPMNDDEINAASDPLMQLAEEIGDLFDGKLLDSTPVARCIDVKNVPIFAPQHLDERRLFTSLITLTFRLGR